MLFGFKHPDPEGKGMKKKLLCSAGKNFGNGDPADTLAFGLRSLPPNGRGIVRPLVFLGAMTIATGRGCR